MKKKTIKYNSKKLKRSDHLHGKSTPLKPSRTIKDIKIVKKGHYWKIEPKK